MSLQEIYDAEINPFYFLKIRHIVGWFLIFTFGIFIQFYIIVSTLNLNINLQNLDPLIAWILLLPIVSLTILCTVRQCNLVGIDLKYLIGRIPPKYNWRSLFVLTIATALFFKGIFRISYYPLLFISPSLLENILRTANNNSLVVEASQSFSPIAYYLFYPIFIVITEIFSSFLILGLSLHRLSTKWNKTKAIIAILLFYMIAYYFNIMGAIAYITVFLLLYLKTQNLIITTIALSICDLLFIVINLIWSFFLPTTTTDLLLQFRSEFVAGVITTFISAPFVIGFIYKNWHCFNKELPYFANKHDSELS